MKRGFCVNVGWLLWLALLIVIVCFPLISHVVNATEVTQDPTNSQNIGIPPRTWYDINNVFESDNERAWAAVAYAKLRVWGWDFSSIPDEDTIDKVEVGIEFFQTAPEGESCQIRVSWDGASSWSAWSDRLTYAGEHLLWCNATDLTDWTKDKLSTSNLRVEIQHRTDAGGGCYGLDAEVGLWEGGMKKVGDVEIGDVLTGWNVSTLEIKGEFEDWNVTNFEPATVLNVTIHEGEWEVLRIIVESEYQPNHFIDVLVTPDHILPYFKVEYNEDGSLDKIEMHQQEAKDFGEGDYVFGFIERSWNLTTGEVIPAHFEPYHFYNVTSMVVDGVADIQTDTKWFMGHYMLAEKTPWTTYLDWMPVRVTHSEGEDTETDLVFFALIHGSTLTMGAFVVLGLILVSKKRKIIKEKDRRR